MPRGIGILFCTHIFDNDIILGKIKDEHKKNEYIFGKKLAKRIEYIQSILGGTSK